MEMGKLRAIYITYSKENFMTKQEVMDSKYNYFVCIEEHEKLFRKKETWKREYLKLKQRDEKQQGDPNR